MGSWPKRWRNLPCTEKNLSIWWFAERFTDMLVVIQGHIKDLQNRLWKNVLNTEIPSVLLRKNNLCFCKHEQLAEWMKSQRGEGRSKSRKSQLHWMHKFCAVYGHTIDCYRTDHYIHMTNDAFNYKALTSVLVSVNSLWQKAENLFNTNINDDTVLLFQYFQGKKKSQQSA